MQITPYLRHGSLRVSGRDLRRDSLAYVQIGTDKRAGPFGSCGPNYGLKRSIEAVNQRWT